MGLLRLSLRAGPLRLASVVHGMLRLHLLLGSDTALGRIRGSIEGLLAAFHPHLAQLGLDLGMAGLSNLDLRQLLLQELQLAPCVHLLRLGADALDFPLVALLALAEDEVVRVIFLERGAGGDSDEG